MNYTIQNEVLKVQVSDKGAEPASIQDLYGTEYLWQGDPKVWGRRAPLLFPVVARLKDERYTLGGTEYHMGIHGFCRDALFSAAQDSPTQVSFTLEDSEETRKQYPYAFRLTVTYALEGNSIRKTHKVENLSNTALYYELGGHDGYRVALAAGESMDDYAIRLPGLEKITPYGMDSANMITPKTGSYDLPNGRMPLKPSAYLLDTIILDELPKRQAQLVDGQDRVRVQVDFEDFPYLGVWTMAKEFDTNYVCIEPWTSLPDATFVGRGLEDKAGVRRLEAGQWEELSYTVRIFSR